ncbi:MAG: hypothetical protein DMG58_01105 [Acidobacteria bacterium]|nr:MAG: hypothetical protein DMG58_01105 [Acidobacteriota bacterium]
MASFGAPLTLGLAAQSLGVRLDGDDLRIAAPQFHFLTGKSLEKLKDGASVAFLAQLSLSPEVNAPAIKRAVDRFIVSYDVWEEKFSVTQTGMERGKVTHLSSTAAEAWCLDRLAVGIEGIAPDKLFWIRLELRAEDPRDQAGVVGDAGINLTRLIEIFSNPARAQQSRWEGIAGPVRLMDLKRERRGSRSG